MTSTDKVKLDNLPTGVGGVIPLSGGGTGATTPVGARNNLQLGNHVTHNYGTTTNTVMMGNDSRVTGAAQKSANLSDLASDSAARQNLGLGTAATRDVGESSGNVMEVGAFGLGRYKDLRNTVYTTGAPADLFGKGYVVGFSDGSLLSPPIGGANTYGTLEVKATYSDSSGMPAYSRSFTRNNRVYIQQAVDASTWGSWSELISTSNILTTTGQSTEYPMTQKAVTDALNTKVGLTGNQTISGLKTFSQFPVTPSAAPTADYQAANKKYVDNSAFGVGQTWQDVTGSRDKGTTYTNTTGKPIYVSVTFHGTSTDDDFRVYIDGVDVFGSIDAWGSNWRSPISVIVPKGSTYQISFKNGSVTRWAELR